MGIKYLHYLLAGILLISSTAAYSLECEVDFRAKRVVKVTNWFGTVNKPEFKSGTASGIGSNKKSCTKDALSDIKKDGWKITFYRLRSSN